MKGCLVMNYVSSPLTVSAEGVLSQSLSLSLSLSLRREGREEILCSFSV
jgi:hypothetical protein